MGTHLLHPRVEFRSSYNTTFVLQGGKLFHRDVRVEERGQLIGIKDL